MKKIFAIILSLTIIITIFSACSAENPEPETTTVQVVNEDTLNITEDNTTFKLTCV